MAFKREGDDNNWLSVLKKRRVAELFAEDIPENEAHLMKNGRFACLVCSYRPVFDTVNMLAIHRQGKKHLASVEHQAAKKQELEELRRKREHEHFVKHGTLPEWSATLPHHSSSGGLLKSAPYDPRVKKRIKVKPHERRPVLDLTPEATTSDSLPGHQVAPQTISQYRQQEKAISANAVCAKPYTRKHGQSGPSCTQTLQNPVPTINHPEQTIQQSVPGPSSTSTSTSDAAKQTPQDLVHKRHQAPTRKKKQGPVYGPAENEEKLKKTQQYLQARGSGWKKDLGGHWVKEEDVEFDSDEEPPDLA